MSKKKNNISNSNSKYNRYQKSNNKKNVKNTKKENLTLTQQQSFHFEEIEDLDSTRNLDISFVDGKNSFKKAKDMSDDCTEILDVDEVKKANLEYNTSLDEKRKNRDVLLCKIFMLLSLCFFIFIIFHFVTVDHRIKVVEKKVIKEVKVVDDNYLFLGDSITELYDLKKYYSKLPVINSGKSGYTTQNILDHLEKMAYQYNPSKVFLLIGTNDLELEVDNEVVVDNIKKIVSNIKKRRPYSKIYLESIYPINNSENEKVSPLIVQGHRHNEDITQINKKLAQFAKEENITYIDLYSKLVGEDGLLKLEYTVDGLHISDDGYQVITDVLNKYIEE